MIKEKLFNVKRNKWIFYTLACIVVFVTTYMLVLPALTIDEQTAIDDPAISNETIAQEEVNELETVADLVDRRGAVCNADMIIGNLWPEENVTNKLKSLERMVVTDLFRSLADYGLEDIVFRDKAGLSLDVNRVDCNYYRYLVGEKLAVHQFRGEYMNQYVFAESTRAYLERKVL